MARRRFSRAFKRAVAVEYVKSGAKRQWIAGRQWIAATGTLIHFICSKNMFLRHKKSEELQVPHFIYCQTCYVGYRLFKFRICSTLGVKRSYRFLWSLRKLKAAGKSLARTYVFFAPLKETSSLTSFTCESRVLHRKVLSQIKGLRNRYIGSFQYISSLSGRWTCPYDSWCVLSSPPNRCLFSSRCDSIHTEKRAKKNPAGLIALRDENIN